MITQNFNKYNFFVSEHEAIIASWSERSSGSLMHTLVFSSSLKSLKSLSPDSSSKPNMSESEGTSKARYTTLPPQH